MESPLQNHPHVAEHPQPVFGAICYLIDEIRLVALYPLVRFAAGEMNASFLQRSDKVSGA
ncbi:hypothetical protein I8Q57_26120 [Klebsiella pneumoniae]|nr:hypothetical protein [Klebsiella pneumoniae]MBH8269387.1 hypothetical protein [Klebsiella pneumoniae]NGN27424.1 hypothetical protein [Klebsiella pneumoniae]NGO02348.1 hypothetical protein [Klebsiella pneumoniae]HBT0661886.1 hypothetical protein [Klebsiella pneumoniae]